MDSIRKLDAGVARGEAAAAAGVLLLMILAAAVQALLRNLTDFEVAWANDALADLEWIDPFLKKGTVWVAFLGASLATYHEKHIAIDILPRIVPEAVRRVMKACVGLGAGATAIGLAVVFWGAVINNAADRPLEYEVLIDGSPSHVCEASDELLGTYEMSRPGFYCAIRAVMNSVGADAETPEGASQFIMPVMFMIIGIRMFGQGLHTSAQIAVPSLRAEESASQASAEGEATEPTEASSEDQTQDEHAEAEGASEEGQSDAEVEDSAASAAEEGTDPEDDDQEGGAS